MLREIFDSLLPDNIKAIPLMQDAIDIFVTNLEQNSDLSIRISDMFISVNPVIKENLFKIYLNAIYDIILNLQKNPDFQAKMAASGRTNALIYNNVDDILNYEFFTTSKTFKEIKGTVGGIDYAYNFASKLEASDINGAGFLLTDLQPFHFRVDGSIFKETYEHVVKPMSHPIGFTYIYHDIIQNSLTDLFGFEYIYDVKQIEVRCLSGYFDVFTSASTDAAVKADFLTRINFLTGELFTEADYYKYVTVYLNKVVQTFTKDAQPYGTYISILFTDGTFLEKYPSPLKIYYRNYIDELNNTNNYIKQYTGHCSLYVDYTEDYQFTTTDTTTYEMDVNIGQIDNSGIAHPSTGIYYSIIDISKCFKVGGNTYNYVPGTDEGAPVDNSTASYVEYTIGENWDHTFTPPDTYVNGVYTEGNDYYLDYTTIQNCEDFIDIGLDIVDSIASEENIVMTNASQVSDDLQILTISSGGQYLYTDDTGLGEVTFTTYSPTVTYSYGDVVEENGNYYAMINTSSVTGTDPATDTSNTYWKPLASPNIFGYYIYSQNSKTYFTTS